MIAFADAKPIIHQCHPVLHPGYFWVAGTHLKHFSTMLPLILMLLFHLLIDNYLLQNLMHTFINFEHTFQDISHHQDGARVQQRLQFTRVIFEEQSFCSLKASGQFREWNDTEWLSFCVAAVSNDITSSHSLFTWRGTFAVKEEFSAMFGNCNFAPGRLGQNEKKATSSDEHQILHSWYYSPHVFLVCPSWKLGFVACQRHVSADKTKWANQWPFGVSTSSRVWTNRWTFEQWSRKINRGAAGILKVGNFKAIREGIELLACKWVLGKRLFEPH